MENQKFEHQSIIKFLILEGQSPTNIHGRMTAVYGDSTPSRTMVFECARRFKSRQLNIEESPEVVDQSVQQMRKILKRCRKPAH